MAVEFLTSRNLAWSIACNRQKSERRRKRVRKGERLWNVIEHESFQSPREIHRDEVRVIVSR
jgi:hypothetical protein